MKILGIDIDNLSREEILSRVEMFLDESKFHQIATINPEFLLEAEKNNNFQIALEQCDIRIADGFGIVLAFLFKGEKLKCRFPGADLLEVILQTAERKNLSVYLAIKKDGLSSYEEIKSALLKKYPALQIDGSDIDFKDIENWSSTLRDEPSGSDSNEKLKIENSATILCNFGAPMQELFLARLKTDFSTLRLALGVGGSFDYLTGKKQRAPRWLRSIGLEWLWRFVLQPKRWKRIWNAVIVFPFRVIFATIKK